MQKKNNVLSYDAKQELRMIVFFSIFLGMCLFENLYIRQDIANKVTLIITSLFAGVAYINIMIVCNMCINCIIAIKTKNEHKTIYVIQNFIKRLREANEKDRKFFIRVFCISLLIIFILLINIGRTSNDIAFIVWGIEQIAVMIISNWLILTRG